MTDYYVRNIDCGQLLADNYTANKFLLLSVGVKNYVRTAEDLMPLVNNEYCLYTPTDGSIAFNNQVIPEYPRDKTDVHIYKVLQGETGGYSSVTSAYDFALLKASDWVDHGWTTPESYGFTEELCAFFETAKVTDSAIYGNDEGDVNLYLITYEYDGDTMYLPIFKVGNDSHYDNIINL